MKTEKRSPHKRENRRPPAGWKFASSARPGFHAVVTPANSPCRALRMFRLNLRAGARHTLRDRKLELIAGVVAGAAVLRVNGQTWRLRKLDAFYLPPGRPAELHAGRGGCVLYLGGAPADGAGAFYVRRYNPRLPLGAIRQVHGRGAYARDVFMVLNPEQPAARLIAGWTWGRPGGWTSWPPHQHERDLEECYAYFDMPPPLFGLHLSYRRPGRPEAAHTVSSGDFVIAPRGYHPTVAIPGVRNTYFWVMAAHRQSSRRYDLAKPDPTMPV